MLKITWGGTILMMDKKLALSAVLAVSQIEGSDTAGQSEKLFL